MTIYTFDDQGVVTSEIYTEVYNDDDGKVLTCITHGNVDKNGNKYTRVSKGDTSWWIKNQTKDRLIDIGRISPDSLGIAIGIQ